MTSLIIVAFHTVAEAYDCATLLRQFQYNINIPEGIALPKLLPNPRNVLPAFPKQEGTLEEDANVELQMEKAINRLVFLKSEEMESAVTRIRDDPNYPEFISKVSSLLAKTKNRM